MKKIVCALLCSLILVSAFAQDRALSQEERMKWWAEARYGMFIHWGIYAVPAGIWKGKVMGKNYDGAWIMREQKIPSAEYRQLAKQFNPTQFNADKLVQFAKEIGMKYIVITAKHHDGFALFKNANPFNVVDATPFKRDIIKEMAVACKKHGIKLGLYYSQAQDWNNGGANYGNDKWWDSAAQVRNFDRYIDSIAVPQVKEILTNYGPIAVIWFDTPTKDMTKENANKIQSLLSLQPQIIENNRLGGSVKGDFGTPEQYIPTGKGGDTYWESCLTTSGTNTWGYKSTDSVWKSPKRLTRNLIETVSKGGNFLLNVGPTAQGILPSSLIDTLRRIGAWMQTNGEAIYRTSAGPFPYLNFGRATQKGNRLYLHIFNYPKNGTLRVPIKNEVVKATLLAKPATKISFSRQGQYVVFQLPTTMPDTIATVVAVDLNGIPTSSIENPIPSQDKPASASSEEGANNTAAKAFDSKNGTMWKAAKGDKTAWVQVDLLQPTSIGAVSISEYTGVVKRFSLEYKNGDSWKTILQDKSIGSAYTNSFTPIKAQIFRLNILEASKEPQIKDIQLYFEE